MAEYKITGTDIYGNPVMETVQIDPATFKRKICNMIIRIWPQRYHNLLYRLGISKFRYITSIGVK